MIKSLFFFFILFLSHVAQIKSLIHHLQIRDDDRNIFKIETFGFFDGGVIELKVSNFNIKNIKNKEKYSRKLEALSQDELARQSPYKAGFILRKSPSESAAQQDLEAIIEKGTCLIDNLEPSDVFLDLSNKADWKSSALIRKISNSGTGLYSLIYARCSPTGPHLSSFDLEAKFYNPGPNYLSAGDSALPTIYLVFFVLFSAALVAWSWTLISASNRSVHNIHYMMLALLVTKCLSLLFESIRYHYIKLFGFSETWSVVYYIFAVLKGFMLFTVILLIGSGWSLMKSYLHDNEKKIIFLVLILQVVDNIAMVVIEETAPGSQGWLAWRDILHLIDIICCCAILLPIVWSIRHLK